MNQKIRSFVIVGVTRDGKRFRPSDWADRLCGVMSAFGADHRMKYSPYVRPGCTLKGDKTVLITDCTRAGGMPDGEYDLGVQHLGASEQAATVAERLADALDRDSVPVDEIGAALGAHLGPGMIGVTIAAR